MSLHHPHNILLAGSVKRKQKQKQTVKMGLSQSKTFETWSSVDVALAVTNMGAAYEVYASEVVTQNVDGTKLVGLAAEDVNSALEGWGVNNRLHRLLLERKLQGLKEGRTGRSQKHLLPNEEWRRKVLAEAQMEYARDKLEHEALTAYHMILQSKVALLSRQCGTARSNTMYSRYL